MIKRMTAVIVMLALVSPIAVIGQAKDQGLVIPEGTVLQLTLQEPVSSKLSEPGDEVIATLRRDVVIDGYTLLRKGTEFIGRVTLAQPAKMPLKGGRLHITFERVKIDGSEQKLTAVVKSASDFSRDEKVKGESAKGDDEGTLKGGKNAGKALQNVQLGTSLGSAGATIIILSGAAREGGIGTGAVAGGVAAIGGGAIAGLLLTKGKEVRLDPNAVIRLRIERPLTVE